MLLQWCRNIHFCIWEGLSRSIHISLRNVNLPIMCAIMYMIAELQKQNVNAVSPFTLRVWGPVIVYWLCACHMLNQERHWQSNPPACSSFLPLLTRALISSFVCSFCYGVSNTFPSSTWLWTMLEDLWDFVPSSQASHIYSYSTDSSSCRILTPWRIRKDILGFSHDRWNWNLC